MMKPAFAIHKIVGKDSIIQPKTVALIEDAEYDRLLDLKAIREPKPEELELFELQQLRTKKVAKPAAEKPAPKPAAEKPAAKPAAPKVDAKKAARAETEARLTELGKTFRKNISDKKLAEMLEEAEAEAAKAAQTEATGDNSGDDSGEAADGLDDL